MAKALKTAALVVGAVALVATGVGAVALGGLAGSLTIAGISTGTLFLVSGGLTVAASLLQKTPKVPASQTDRLSASVNPGAFRHTVLGQTAMPVEVRYEEWSGKDQEYCDWIVLHASHACEAIDEIWFETTMAWSRTTGVVGKYAGYFSVPHIVLEGSPANAFVLPSGKWNQNARLTGCAYSHWRFKLTGNSKKAESPFASGLPSRITVIGRGAKLYDPRRDSTVPGGNGPMRADDQSTWRFTTDDGVTIGENLPLQILRVVLGWRIRNPSTGDLKLAAGSGVPSRRINLPSIAVAANLADELVNRSAGGQEPRYHGAGVVSEGDDPKTVLDMLCTACCARFRDTGGKLSLVVAHNDLAAAATEDGLNDDDVVGGFTWDPDAALEATPNVVRGKYVDATTNSLYQLIDYPEIRLPSLDGQDRIFPLDLGVVESPSQAQRIAKQVLQRKQYPREFSAPFDIRAWKYGVGDVVPFTFAALGFKRALFRVKDQELGQGGVCNMTLTVENAAIYAWDADDSAPVRPAEPIVYDSRNNPLILAIDVAATTAGWSGVADDNGKKPTDFADVTGDNTSKDTNAIGGIATSDFLAANAAFQGRVDVLEGETIPAINGAVTAANSAIDAARSDAQTRINEVSATLAGADAAIVRRVDEVATEFQNADAATNTRVTDSVAILANADEALGRRIDSISSGGTYDDTAVRAEISRVDLTAINRDGAITSSIETAISEYRGLNDSTNSRVTQEVTTLAGVNTALSQRVDTIVAEYRGLDSTTNARISDEVSSLASAALAAASRTTIVEASIGTALNTNAYFTVTGYNGGVPYGWTDWSYATAQAFRSDQVGRNGTQPVKMHREGAQLVGISQPINNLPAGYYVIEADVQMFDGNWQGSGLHVNFNNGTSVVYSFGAEPDISGLVYAGNGYNRRQWSALVYNPAQSNSIFYAMAGWDVFSLDGSSSDTHWHCAVIRPATDGEIKGGKADAALNGANGVYARLTVAETAIVNADQKYAAASRVSTIEASYNGLNASVTEQAGAIAGLNGKTAAYLRITADAGNGYAQLTLFSDAYGGAWELVGNGRIRGNLVVDGTIITAKIAPNATSQIGVALLAGGTVDQGTSVQTDVFFVQSTGQPITIDVQFEAVRTAAGTGSLRATLYQVSGGTTIALKGVFVRNSTLNAGGPQNFWWLSGPPAGPTGFYLVFDPVGSGGTYGAFSVESIGLRVTEFKR